MHTDDPATGQPAGDDTATDALARALGPLGPAPTDDFDVEALLAFQHGELDEAAAAEVEARLAVDPEARAFLADLDAAPSPFLTRWAETKMRPARTGRIAGLVTVLAMAAAVAIFALRPRVEAPPAFGVSQLRGVTLESRDEGPDLNAESWRVDGEARLSVTLAPDGALPEGTLVAAAYVDGADGTLEKAAVQPAVGEGGAVVLEARVGALLGDRTGRRSIYVALTTDADGPPDATGRAPPEAEVDGAVRWRVLRFDYTAGGAP